MEFYVTCDYCRADGDEQETKLTTGEIPHKIRRNKRTWDIVY